MNPLSQLQHLLRELFQLDLADLDFGLYRLLHLKRAEIEAFLEEQLPRRVEEAFGGLAAERRVSLEEEIAELAERIRQDVHPEAIQENGEVHPNYQSVNITMVRTYQEKRSQLREVRVTEAQKAEVFNHLYAFFDRYYEDGDFIPSRRYGSRPGYAAPYNGEETFFHWANKDQHYVKTGETFRDYAFRVPGLDGERRVRFVLAEASVPPGNTKGDRRYFFPLPEQAAWEAQSRTFRLPFHYRLPTEAEVERYGSNSKLQEGILAQALDAILAAIPDDLLSAALREPVEHSKDGEPVPLLLKRLRHFARRNTTDYFVHRNLERFLRDELEFYLKDQVLNLGDLEGDLEGKRRTLRVVRRLAEAIIAFLAQLEEVQRRLFEKRKLVLRTDYLVTIKEVPRSLWAEVLANRAQREAWQRLFAIEAGGDGGPALDEHFLEAHPTLVVDTAHFSQDFKERLLAAIDDLDGVTDGLLVHSENYQALRLLERKYAGQVKCIYIDPPYNTGSDDFIYKDRYRHSSWLALMEERLRRAMPYLSPDGVVFCSIDSTEMAAFTFLMNDIFGIRNGLGTIVWKNATERVFRN